MKIFYSLHAKKRIIERKIKEKYVHETINFPNYTIKRSNEIEAYKKINNKILKVVYFQSENYIKVITVYNLG